MKLYKINGKVYEALTGYEGIYPCKQCSLYETGKRRYCPSAELLGKCSSLGYKKYFVEYSGNTDDVEVIELIKEKKVYKRIKKGFTRRDVLRELILELKEKYGVDIVRTCDSVDQCKNVIAEIIKIHANNITIPHLEEKSKLEKTNEMLHAKLLEVNKKKITADKNIEYLNSEIKKLNSALDNTENSRIEWVNIAKHNDKLYTDEFIKVESLEEELRKFKSDNEILGMWLRESEDRGVISLIVFKTKRLFNKLFGNGYDK